MQLENPSRDRVGNGAKIREGDFRSRHRRKAGEIIVIPDGLRQDGRADSVDPYAAR